jgi:formylglycine-generating enzyme required for sulfatase activity
MGSPASESGRRNDETQLTVALNTPFSIGIHEVTQCQYKNVIGGSNPSLFRGTDDPAERVSWMSAVEFCKKLSALPLEQAAGRIYRLPTEAAWEYACRAGSTTTFSFGNNES